ncbi:MAG: hypothetical protein BAA02_14545 [Paenibacillaceae bacterium ZCTH02-B3]|nr:MAG: hypothetical protein BAA02_14545 [Paenibacillaceae bacterium ZCTH02-B3]
MEKLMIAKAAIAKQGLTLTAAFGPHPGRIIVPALIIRIIFNRHFVKGVTFTGIKQAGGGDGGCRGVKPAPGRRRRRPAHDTGAAADGRCRRIKPVRRADNRRAEKPWALFPKGGSPMPGSEKRTEAGSESAAGAKKDTRHALRVPHRNPGYGKKLDGPDRPAE